MDKCIRRCCACRENKSKDELIRVLRTPDESFVIDLSNKSDGRGAYVCKNADCINKVIKKRGLNHSFGCAVPGSIYGELENIGKDIGDETR